MSVFFNAKEVIDIAKLVEVNGERFYNEAARLASNSDLICLFEYLAAEEKVHQQIFDEIGERLSGQKGMQLVADSEEERIYLEDFARGHMFNMGFDEIEKMIKKNVEGTKILGVALKFEVDSIAFFEQLKKVTPTEWGGSEIDNLIDEEKAHLKKLELLKKDMEAIS